MDVAKNILYVNMETDRRIEVYPSKMFVVDGATYIFMGYGSKIYELDCQTAT